MKKIYTLLFTLIIACPLHSQSHFQSRFISDMFHATFSKSVNTGIENKPFTNIYTTNDSALFIVNRKGFQSKTLNGAAKISIVNAFTGIEETCFLLPSPGFLENGGLLSRTWIWALAASDSLLLVTVDEEIWIYLKTDSGKYKYMKTIAIENGAKLEVINNDLHVFVENSDGFDWYKVNLSNNEINYVRKLVLKNHFFLQISPQKIIAMSHNALYLLQQNEPSIEKYSLSGKLLKRYAIKIEQWNSIPEEITKQLDSIEDITERNYAFTKYSIFENNFMHLFYLFPSERFFMKAIDRNSVTETFITPYFIQIVGDTTIIEPYSMKLNENEKFGEKYFPFITSYSDGNLIFTQINEYISQINNATTVSWKDKTQKEYKQDVNLYHKENEPIEKIETYHLVKNYLPADSVQFLDLDDNIFSLNDIQEEKAIFIIMQYPQCSTCAKVIWNFFSDKIPDKIALFSVAQDCGTYLMKKENIKETKLYLTTEFIPLFYNSKKLNSTMKLILTQKANPIIVLFDKKLHHIEVISSAQILNDIMGNINPEFLHTIDNFIEN